MEAFVVVGGPDKIFGPLGFDTAESTMAHGRNAIDAHYDACYGHWCATGLGQHFGRHQRRRQKRWVLYWQIGSYYGHAARFDGWLGFPWMLGIVLEFIQIPNSRTVGLVDDLLEKSQQHEKYKRNDELVDDAREFSTLDRIEGGIEFYNFTNRFPSVGVSSHPRRSVFAEFHRIVNEYNNNTCTAKEETVNQMDFPRQLYHKHSECHGHIMVPQFRWYAAYDMQFTLYMPACLFHRQLNFSLNSFAVSFSIPINVKWIKVNSGQNGYYRVLYDEDNWGYIVEELKLNHESFSPMVRYFVNSWCSFLSVCPWPILTYSQSFH